MHKTQKGVKYLIKEGFFQMLGFYASFSPDFHCFSVCCAGPAAFNSKLNIGSCARLHTSHERCRGPKTRPVLLPSLLCTPGLLQFQLQSRYAKLKQILTLPPPLQLHHTNKLPSQSCSRKTSIGPFNDT